MSMIICRECGKEISDQATNCPNCGCPILTQQPQQTTTQKPEKKQNSTLSIWACVLSIFGCTAFIGFILGLVDLCKNDKSKKHTGSWFAVIICIIYAIVVSVGFSGTDEKKDQTVVVNSTEDSENEEKQEEIESVVNDGSFDVDGLSITIKETNTNYTDYDDEYGWHKLESGKKYIMVSFDCVNNSDSDKYVSIYDYDCYADGTLCEQYYGFNGDFINANISSGRNVSFQTFYIVPEDAQSIELEYKELVSFDDSKIIIKIQ